MGEKTAVEYHEVSTERAGQRLDNFLLRYLRGVPKSLVYRILRTGEVRVNKGRAKPAYKLQAGDIIRIPPLRQADAVPIDKQATQGLVDQLRSAILLETTDFLVLNKPAGLAVHGGSGLRYGLIEVLKAADNKYKSLELVHRLDRQTSGCLLLAKNTTAMRHINSLIKNRQISKSYLALVKGCLLETREVDLDLTQHRQHGEKRVTVAENSNRPAKSALTIFKPQTQLPIATLVEVDIVTGRTHQIRVHAQAIGHPLAGDDKYGDAEFNNKMKNFGLMRLFLHASQLQFTLDQEYCVKAPLDQELTTVIAKLDE